MDHDKIESVLKRLKSVIRSNTRLDDTLAIEATEDLIRDLRVEIGNQETRIVELEEAQREWQPIETAPKTGTFLVYMPREDRKFQVMYRSERFAVVGGAFAFDLTKPTHWAPLPTPPKPKDLP